LGKTGKGLGLKSINKVAETGMEVKSWIIFTHGIGSINTKEVS
jgi:hypothetical protein